MLDFPEDLARSILAGDCVLWVGAGFGSLAGRPGWEELLRRLVDDCPDDAKPALKDLLEQGRLRTVLTYVHRHLGDEPLAKVLKDVSTQGELREGAELLTGQRWRACFATTYADVVAKLFTDESGEPDVLYHRTVHYLSLREQSDFFILRTPPTGRAMRTDGVLFDLVEEVLRSRTILFLGFEPDDPDLVQILDLMDRIGRGNTHYAVLPYVTAPEAEEFFDRFGIEVIRAPNEVDLVEVAKDLRKATESVAMRPSDLAGQLATLDLTRAVRGVNPRADLAVDDALTLDENWIEHLIDALPGGSLSGVDPTTLLRAGSVMLAHGEAAKARRCFSQVASMDLRGEMQHLARFNLALTSLAEGDAAEAQQGLSEWGLGGHSLSIVPPRFQLKEVLRRTGAQLLITCIDRQSKDEFDISVATLARPVGGEEQATFSEGVQKLSSVEHKAVCRALGGFADGRLFGVMYQPTPGFVLADTLESDDEPMPLSKAVELIIPLIEGLEVCHARGVLHRNINPHRILLAPAGPMLRGFGFPPVIGFMRPSVREVNRGYLAPEVVSRGEASPASDVYGLAAVLYRCLTGAAPSGSVPGPSSVQPSLDPRLDPLLAGALHPDPAKRLPLSELRKQLQQIVDTPELGRRVVKTEEAGASLSAGGAGMATVGGGPVGEASETLSAPATVRIVPPEDHDDLEAWAWIIERKPANAEAREAILRIESEAREQGRWDRLSEVLGVKSQHTQIQTERVAILRELVDLFESKLGAPGNAFSSLQSLIEQVDVGEQVALVDELVRLAEVTGQWPELADSMLIVAERTTDPAQQANLYTELGKVYAERLGANDRAVAAYDKAIELAPSAENLGAIVRLHRNAGRHPELAGRLLSLADFQEGEERNTTLLSAAKVLREELGDEEGAFGALEILLAETPDHFEGLEHAESVARQLERWDSLVDILSRRATATLDATEAAALRREAASLALAHQEDKDAAITLLGDVIENDRSDRGAAAELADLLRERVGDDPGCRPRLIDALGVLIDLTDVADDKAAMLVECATLLDQEPDGRDRAIDCREQIFDVLPVDRDPCRDAANALEQTYRRLENHRALEALQLRQANADYADENFRARAWQKVLELRDGPTRDPDGGIEALEALTALEPTETRWRDDLLKRYLEREEFKKAGPLIRAQVFDEEDPKRKAELLLRGGILREQIGKIEGAVEALEEAVQLDPSLTRAWLALRDLYQDNEQPLKAVEALVSAGLSNTNRLEKVKQLYQASGLYLDELDRPEKAVDLLERVVELDPDHREATGILLERVIASGDLKRAWPHAQIYVMQVRGQAPGDKKQNLRALSLAGRCALAAEQKDKARDYLEKAKALDATNLDVLRLLADLDMEAGNWSDALRNYQSVVLGIGEKASPSELSGVYVRMADARVGMDERAKAVQMLERALDVDSENEVAATQLIALQREIGGPPAVVRAAERMVDILTARIERADTDEARESLVEDKVEILREIADQHLTQMQMPEEAVRTLERVLEVRPDDPAILHQILDVLTQAQRWGDATNVLERLAAAQDTGQLRAKYLYAGALIMRDNLGNRGTATELLRKVVDADPTHTKAFDAYVEQLRGSGKWLDLSKVIRTHLKAVQKDAGPDRLVQLFEALGESYEKQRDLKTAVAAYDQAAKLAARTREDDESQNKRRMRVMRMAVQLGADELTKAVHHGHAVIASNPMELEVYHRLVELYLKQGARDRARAVARTLKFLKQADEAEIELAEGGGASHLTGSINRDQWRKQVYHPLENALVSDLLSVIWPIVAAREGRTHEHHGVDRSSRVDVTLQSPTGLARFLAHACQVLDAPVPDLFLRQEHAGGAFVDAVSGADASGKRSVYPTVLAGRAALSDNTEVGLKFRAGRAVAKAKPEHILASVLPSSAIVRHAILGAIRLTVPGAHMPPDAASGAETYAELLRPYITAARLEQLQLIAKAVWEKDLLDARAWRNGVAYTTTRAGFILCDNLDHAAQHLTREGDEGSPVPAKERIRDLIAYSVSEPYLKLRRKLGLAR